MTRQTKFFWERHVDRPLRDPIEVGFPNVNETDPELLATTSSLLGQAAEKNSLCLERRRACIEGVLPISTLIDLTGYQPRPEVRVFCVTLVACHPTGPYEDVIRNLEHFIPLFNDPNFVIEVPKLVHNGIGNHLRIQRLACVLVDVRLLEVRQVPVDRKCSTVGLLEFGGRE